VAEWGPGIFGAEQAARVYYGKSAADLDLDEAIAMAAVLPSPLKHTPVREDRYVQWRKAWILSRLQRWGGVPRAPEPAAAAEPDWVQAEEADITPAELLVPDAPGNSPAARSDAQDLPLPLTPTAL
jgi:membrane peptidoglycan carboxypeptidase